MRTSLKVVLSIVGFLFLLIGLLPDPPEPAEETPVGVAAKPEPGPIPDPEPVEASDPVREDEIRAMMEADLSGVWSLGYGGGFVYFYPDGNLKWLATDCSIKALARWKYESRNISITQNGQEMLFTTVIDFKPNRSLTVATGRDWLFLGRDLNMKC